MRNKILNIFFILVCVNLSIADEWHIDKKAGNSVTFLSSTSLLDFEGNTGLVDGYLYWEGDSLLTGKNEIYFEVQLASFKTGVGKRDQDMRNDVLHTGTYPLAILKGKAIKTYRENGMTVVDAACKLTLHGVTKSLNLKAKIEKIEDRILVKSDFSVQLKDYNIEAPSLMAFIKVAQEIKIKVQLNLIKVK